MRKRHMTSEDHRRVAVSLRMAERLLRVAHMTLESSYSRSTGATGILDRLIMKSAGAPYLKIRSALDNTYLCEHPRESRSPYFGIDDEIEKLIERVFPTSPKRPTF